MRSALVLLLAGTVSAQSPPQIQISHTTQSLRGISAVSRNIAWASGTHGTYLRTLDGGQTWIPAQVPGATALDFRAVVAFSASEAFLMSAGPGSQSRIYYTADAGRHWQLQFTSTNPKGFFDSMAFWDPKHGVVLGDPFPDPTGKLKFELLATDDGQTWHDIPPSQLPEAIEGEGAFAASNTCIAILREAPWRNSPPTPHEISWRSGPSGSPGKSWKSGPSGPRRGTEYKGASAPADPNLWFATGGKAARVFHSHDRGQTWTVSDAPIIRGPASAGIFSIAFRDVLHGIIAGGDYKHPAAEVPNLAVTTDGGKTWRLQPALDLKGYIASVALDLKTRWFAVGPDYIAVASQNHRIKYPNLKFNALGPIPEGGAFAVGPNGSIAYIK